jgi:hypothetical protein
MSADGLHNFQLSFCEGSLLSSMKTLTYCEIPSSNPLQKARSGFLIAASAFKSFSELVNAFKEASKNFNLIFL